MRALNDIFANFINAWLDQIHQRLDEIQGIQQTDRPRPAARRERPRRTNRSEEEIGEKEFHEGDSKSLKKSTTTCAPVAEQPIFVSEKSNGKSENTLEELKDFSDSLPILDEYGEDLIESLIICGDKCDRSLPGSHCMLDDE